MSKLLNRFLELVGYLVKWRTYYVAQDLEEAVAGRAVEYVEWTDKQGKETLKLSLKNNQLSYTSHQNSHKERRRKNTN